MALLPTPSQTVGPFFHIALADRPTATPEVVSPDHPGAIRVWGNVFDGLDELIDDALVEIWQANRAGRYAHPEDTREDVPLEPGFRGFGRCATDLQGRFEFVTVKPGAVPGPGGRMQAPHLEVGVFARGLLKRVSTRMYFPDETEANAADPVLTAIEDPAERSTLVAVEEGPGLRFDVHLQGDRQTAFFDV